MPPPAGHDLSGDGLPAALRLPETFARHRPTRDQLRGVVEALTPSGAATMPWPALLEHLVSAGRTDVPASRLVEAHIDALRILDQAGASAKPGAVYAVWASRSHATGLRAERHGRELVLDGTLRFTSGAGIVDRALVPVWPAEDTHLLLDLEVTDWPFELGAWRTRAMETTRTAEVRLDRLRVVDDPVGAENSYLERPGFQAGGVGVAAAWAGCALRVLDLLVGAVPAERRTESQTVRLGRVWTELTSAVAVLRDAGPRLEPSSAPDLHALATRVRAAVGAGVRRALTDARSIAGPAGLALDESLTRAVDDTALFVAQQHEDNDARWLGQRV